jgi:hypothetical protein
MADEKIIPVKCAILSDANDTGAHIKDCEAILKFVDGEPIAIMCEYANSNLERKLDYGEHGENNPPRVIQEQTAPMMCNYASEPCLYCSWKRFNQSYDNDIHH